MTDVYKSCVKILRWNWFVACPLCSPTRTISQEKLSLLRLFPREFQQIVINRGSHGYGFTVFGSSPVQIGRIEDGSPAAEAGLQRYDCIVRINGQNVSRSTAESVAKIVRESELVIGLEIQRLRTGGDGEIRNPKSTKASNFDSLPGNPVACASIGGILAGHLRRPQCLRGFGSQEFPRMGVSTAAASKQRLAAVESDRIRALDLDRASVASSSDFSGSSSSSWMASSDETLVTSDSREGDGRTGGPGGGGGASASFQFRRKARLAGGGGADDPDEANSDSGYGDRWRLKAMNCGKTSPNEDMLRLQWSAVRKLIGYEEDFVYQLQLGARIFLKPLRQKQQSILSTDEHRGLFQNLETILSLSETHLGQLYAHKNLNQNQSSSDADTDADDVSEIRLTVPLAVLTSVYLATIESFCEAYEKYCDGIREAFHLLAALKKATDIEQFLNKASIDCGKLTLSSFLQKPIEHIKDLVLSLQKILCYTSANASGYEGLKQIIKALRSCCYRINENNSLRCGSSLSLASRESAGTKDSLSPPLSSSSSSPPSVANSIVSSIDTEVFEIQNRLLFPAHIPCFQLATASHHMIYSGKLKLIDDAGSWLPLFLVLMSDLILLTRPDPDGEVLHVLEEPIVLHDVVGCNFNCSHSCEFVLYVETPLKSLQRTWEPRCLRIRAPSGELKCTWKNILEQRIQTCKSNREVTISNRRLDNVV